MSNDNTAPEQSKSTEDSEQIAEFNRSELDLFWQAINMAFMYRDACQEDVDSGRALPNSVFEVHLMVNQEGSDVVFWNKIDALQKDNRLNEPLSGDKE